MNNKKTYLVIIGFITGLSFCSAVLALEEEATTKKVLVKKIYNRTQFYCTVMTHKTKGLPIPPNSNYKLPTPHEIDPRNSLEYRFSKEDPHENVKCKNIYLFSEYVTFNKKGGSEVWITLNNYLDTNEHVEAVVNKYHKQYVLE